MSDEPLTARTGTQASSANSGFEALASALSNDDDTDFSDTPAFPSEIRKTSTASLDDELALWEILDMDADGEEAGAQGIELDDLANALINA
ncbi:hypothetical protein C8Q73DRAFT_720105 [Cubamyces lactineus]|nr:hypothetical protein C8Q73DRAFT_720105 [Cubamyces lactineus]